MGVRQELAEVAVVHAVILAVLILTWHITDLKTAGLAAVPLLFLELFGFHVLWFYRQNRNEEEPRPLLRALFQELVELVIVVVVLAVTLAIGIALELKFGISFMYPLLGLLAISGGYLLIFGGKAAWKLHHQES